tara:strand:+ start:249 stop:857 length:609 start_codon:yes stop_codon:yes gene_type:complete
MDQLLEGKDQKMKVINKNQLIKEDETLLLILDMQEKLINNIKDNQKIIFNIRRLIDTCNLLNINVALTEQNPLKLGKTIKSILENNEYPNFEKMEFSCLKNESFINFINEKNFQNIIICGIESHICVLQTAIELLGEGINILIPRDCIGSRHELDNQTAFLRLVQSGAIASTAESLICELCKTSSRKEFREISKILKKSFSK